MSVRVSSVFVLASASSGLVTGLLTCPRWSTPYKIHIPSYRQSVGLLGLVISPSQERYLHRTIHTQIDADRRPSFA
jgi:hypothetical protein